MRAGTPAIPAEVMSRTFCKLRSNQNMVCGLLARRRGPAAASGRRVGI